MRKDWKLIMSNFKIANQDKQFVVVGILNEYGEEVMDYEVSENNQRYIIFGEYDRYETAAMLLNDIEDTENDEYEFERSCCNSIFIHSKDTDDL